MDAQEDTRQAEKPRQNGVFALTGIRYGLGGVYHFDPAIVEELAGKLRTVDQVAEALGVSESTIKRRLQNDPEFIAAYGRGLEVLRNTVAADLIRHSSKNVIATLALANQPHIFGFVNGRQEVSGRVEHVHSLSPAMTAFAQRREQAKLSASPKAEALPEVIDVSPLTSDQCESKASD